jgi:ornithine decarboxylase
MTSVAGIIRSLAQKTLLKSENMNIECLFGPQFELNCFSLKNHNQKIQICCGSIEQIISSNIDEHDLDDTPFYILDVATVVKKLIEWKTLLPNIEPHYAVKCNGDPILLQSLLNLGTKFDCASQGEIEMMMRMGAKPEDIIFANPCKPKGHLNYAKKMGVKQMTFDNYQELVKIREVYPDAELFLRIVVDDYGALCQFSSKFGANLLDVPKLLNGVNEMGLNLVGVSFHVGSGQQTVEAFTDAIENARKIFDMAEDYGIHMSCLDIGGGFPGDNEDETINFEVLAKNIRLKIDELFPNTRIIAEPGRYFAASCCFLATKITSIRDQTNSDYESNSDYLYYINDGVYGSFNNIIMDHATCLPTYLIEKSQDQLYRSTIFGPSCDGIDIIVKSYPLSKMNIGEWIYWENMGAYTMCAASSFNGFPLPKVHYIWKMY